MKRYVLIICIVVSGIILLSFTELTKPADEISFPEGYRRWTHIKSNVLGPDNPIVKYRGYNHIYANEKAFQGYQSGVFPDGSILVFDVLEANVANKATSEGKRVLIDVMVRDAVKYASTGGWGYAEFDPDGKPLSLTNDQILKCYNCHVKQPDNVFSEFRK
jgi:hypothetical protein